MCDTCGCGAGGVRRIEVNERLLAANASEAVHNRVHFARLGVFTVNVMGAPGSGKTALLERTIASARSQGRIAVIEGDQATERDSERIRAAGARACQIETGLGCHLDAIQVHDALHRMDLAGSELLFIENVGNLVCPALFDLGEHLRVLVTAPTEGADKPLKYPPMFRAADIVLLNKCDLSPHLSFDEAEWRAYVLAVNPPAEIIRVSASSGEGIEAWLAALDRVRTKSAEAAVGGAR